MAKSYGVTNTDYQEPRGVSNFLQNYFPISGSPNIESPFKIPTVPTRDVHAPMFFQENLKRPQNTLNSYLSPTTVTKHQLPLQNQIVPAPNVPKHIHYPTIQSYYARQQLPATEALPGIIQPSTPPKTLHPEAFKPTINNTSPEDILLPPTPKTTPSPKVEQPFQEKPLKDSQATSHKEKPVQHLPTIPFRELNLHEVNPGWSRFSFMTPEGRRNNCAYAAYAGDLRIAGIDPGAVSGLSDEGVDVFLTQTRPKLPFLNRDTLTLKNPYFEESYGIPMRKGSFEEIREELLRRGPGARAYIDAKVRFHGHRHAFLGIVMVSKEGKPVVRWIDPQRNRRIPELWIDWSFNDPFYGITSDVLPSRQVVVDDNYIGKDWFPVLPPIPIPIVIPIIY